ncbi:class I SAM-dependent methyltransferase [Edaphobacter sp.]|uniref:class I SAM-dependent methyltransferase n=1 Tax=Edaphobacter sp. TaxID=1934404 RepID=UPI002DBEB228|nr:methyltransferase domain-containing protein [Edaphobacter sp.]HEU5340122.1 methyltransferase domain-containing protein [Edaphobacter sp.]
MTQALFDKYYYSRPEFEGGELPFFRLCREQIPSGAKILEVGSGPSNDCSKILSEIGPVTGLDIDPDVKTNRWLSQAHVFDGKQMPFADASFDACVSSFVLEHVSHPVEHFAEVGRVLRPGGVYCLRTPNLIHYVSAGAYIMPHFVHLLLANRLRELPKDAHDPYPTWYRSNTRSKLRRLCLASGLGEPVITMIEPEPSYGRAHPLLFYPMMAYERFVNSSDALSGFRITMLLVAHKHA